MARTRKSPQTTRTVLRQAVQAASQLREHLIRNEAGLPEGVRSELKRRLPGQDESQRCDELAQAMLFAGMLSSRTHASCESGGARSDAACDQLTALLGSEASRHVLDLVRPVWEQLDFARLAVLCDEADEVPLYERFLGQLDQRRRRQSGVFYTPLPLVRHLLMAVNNALKNHFALPAGLADATSWAEMIANFPGLRVPAAVSPDAPFLQLLDPATGTGSFLTESLRLAGEGRTAANGASPPDLAGFASRLYGFELSLAPLVIAQAELQSSLRAGHIRSAPGTLAQRLWLTNTLDPDWDEASRNLKLQYPFTVIVGNPPYSGDSRSRNAWIEGLTKGQLPSGETTSSYYEVAGQPLKERKLWLQDDYVKFFAFAQWKIQQSGCGVVAFVCNHGLLDNPTFRGMRWQLLQTFNHITVLDLHGSRKKREYPPAEMSNENVFSIEQGTAVVLLVRSPHAAGRDNGSPAENGHRPVQHGDVWGSRQEKLASLSEHSAEELATNSLSMSPPGYFFYPRSQEHEEEYARGWPLDEIMPLNSTAIVTARDHFVISMDREELVNRMRQFCDPNVPDEEIRSLFTRRTRSPRHLPGDTRGWQLPKARAALRAAGPLDDLIQPIWYRPLDRRYMVWSEAMIDWPRPEVSQHMLLPGNMALIARRQSPATQACTFFWVTDGLAIDGLIRSDNRGSESFFPLWLAAPEGTSGRMANFNPSFVGALCGQFAKQGNSDAAWVNESAGKWNTRDNYIGTAGSSGDESQVSPAEVLAFIYAQLHCPSYRTRFAAQIPCGFPRIFLPREARLFRRWVAFGQELLDLHLMRPPRPHRGATSDAKAHNESVCDEPSSENYHGDIPTHIASGFPRHQDDSIWLNSRDRFSSISEASWDFLVGGHQVCRKWLRDRRSRELRTEDVATYARLTSIVQRTREIMDIIDRDIAPYGWETAFSAREQPVASR